MANTTKTAKNTKETATGNTKLRARRWVFTLNNFTDDEDTTIKKYLSTKTHVVGYEIGENGTAHLQGYFEDKNPISFETLKKIMPRAHFEKANGSADDNYKYCSKDGVFYSNMPETEEQMILRLEYNNDMVVWKPWQQDIINMIHRQPDNRKIHFVVDTIGNSGKSYLAKYLIIKYKDIIITNGRAENSFNQLLTHRQQKKRVIAVLVDCPRCKTDYLSYEAIEAIKNGCFYSGKYEGGQLAFCQPHVIVFMNERPNITKLTDDRYDIVEL